MFKNSQKIIILFLLPLFSTAVLLSSTLVAPNVAIASGDHSHGSDEKNGHSDDHDSQGPHGGKLLKDGNFSTEISIVKSGAEPEIRVYLYLNDTPITASDVEISITLTRLGGIRDQLSFTQEHDYWVSHRTIPEPHSYDVNVEVRWKNRNMNWHYANYEGRSQLTERQQERANIETRVASRQSLNITNTLFGVVATPENRTFKLSAPYAGIITRIHVNTGDKVKRGQTLLTIRNRSTLQDYSIQSPTDGEVSERLVNLGERADQQPLMTISDLSSVWVEMSAFPEDIEQLAIGQTVTVKDMHDHDSAEGNIEYIAPQMTEGHIARARVSIANPQGHWRPGMHVEATIATETINVDLAVEKMALQTFHENEVVFAKFGNTFEARPLKLGKDDGHYVEVLNGLEAGTVYVTKNSFLLKADILKDGASHDH